LISFLDTTHSLFLLLFFLSPFYILSFYLILPCCYFIPLYRFSLI